MPYNFSEEELAFIKSAIEKGLFESEDDLIVKAVRRMKEDIEENKRFKEAVAVGKKALKEGKTVPYTADFMDKAMERAREKIAYAKKNPGQDLYSNNDAIPY